MRRGQRRRQKGGGEQKGELAPMAMGAKPTGAGKFHPWTPRLTHKGYFADSGESALVGVEDQEAVGQVSGWAKLQSRANRFSPQHFV